MKISVITTCYNRERTIARAMDSVLAQNYRDVEYIIVDGASKDSSVEIINGYKGRVSTIVSEKDGGMYEAINKGVRLATGDAIGLIHSDDEFFDANVLEEVAGAFATSGADIVYGNGIFVDEDAPGRTVRNWISGKYDRDKVRRGWLPLHPTVYVRREVFEKAGLYDEGYRIAADSDWLVRILYEYDFKVFYLDRYIVRMNMGGLSTSLKTQVKKWKEDLRMYRAHGFCAWLSLGCKIASKIKQF